MSQLTTLFTPSALQAPRTPASMKSRLRRYGFALFATFVATLLHFLIHPVITGVFDLFLATVFLSALYGGLGPALLAAGASIISFNYFFMAPFNAFAYAVTDIMRVVIFAAVSFLTSSLSVRLKQTNSKLEQAQQGLEMRIQERTEELTQANLRLKDEVAQRLEAQTAILQISNREQRRLGQDLHDGLIQILTGARLIVEGMKHKLSIERHPLSEDVEMVESCLTDALTQADTISRGLYPVELERNGLVAALRELAVKTSKVNGIECLFISAAPLPINDTATATHLYRIAQEAVSNAIKGGKAKRIHIRLFKREEDFYLTIADNGIGLGRSQPRNGMGLQIMNYRAKFINGVLRFKSRQRGGTLVICRFQLKNEGERYEKRYSGI